jgi:putative spermidine/putrescine transport system permease protein
VFGLHAQTRKSADVSSVEKGASRRLKKNFTHYWLILPALLVVALLFGGGFFFAAAESFGYFSAVGNAGFTFANFVRVFNDREVIAAFYLTLFVTFVSTIISAICGTITAHWLRNKMRKSAFLNTLLQFPLAVPHLAVSLLLLNILAPSGIFARFFYLFGLIETPSDFPVLVADEYGIGIIFSYVLKETPFIALIILTVLARTGDDLEQVARNLGASAIQRFRFVTLPLIAPSLVFSSLIVWIFVFGAFEVPYILGRSYPSMLAVAVQRKFNGTDLTERPEALALAILMMVITTIFVGLYLRLTKNLVGFEKTSVF